MTAKDYEGPVGANDVAFLQGLSEAELTELVLIPMLEHMGYREIRYTHGVVELGKDIVFARDDPLAGTQYMAATVKSRPLNGAVSSSQSIHEVFFQLQQALREPFVSPFSGDHVLIDTVFLITPYPIAQLSIKSISSQLRDLANRVRFIDGPSLVRLVQEHVPDLLLSLPDPESRYLQHLCSGFLRATPLGALGESRRLSVHDLYVLPSLSHVSSDDAKYISFATPSETSPDRIVPTQLLEQRSAVVLADVGSGKTTLLQRLVIEVAKDRQLGGKRWQSMLPVFVPLAHFRESDLTSAAQCAKSLEGYVYAQQGFDLLSSGTQQPRRHLLLLDGFDELVGSHDNVQACILNYAQLGFSVVVTSRPSRIPNLAGFSYYRLNPFSQEDVRQFLERWFTGRKEISAQVAERISGSASLLDLCRTPLMLTLYAILASEIAVDVLPTRRTDVYKTIADMLLGGWDKLRHIKNNFSADAKQQILENIAYQSHSSRRRRFGSGEVRSIAERILKPRRGRSYRSTEPEAMLSEIVFRSSLLRQTDQSGLELEFAHLSFQEYFCACRLLRRGDAREILQLVQDDWWKNTLSFYFGICRSLDGLLVSGHLKKRHGLGLRLLEYLVEADYTGPDARRAAFQLVGREVLESGGVNENVLAICRRVGNEVVDAIEATLPERHGNWFAMNLFRVLFAVNTERARQVLLSNAELLEGLSTQQLAEVLDMSMSLLPHDVASSFEFNGFQLLVERLRGIRRQEWLAAKRKVGSAVISGLRMIAEGRSRKRKKELTEVIGRANAAYRLLAGRFGGKV